MRSYVMLSELAKDSGNLSEERNVLQEAKKYFLYPDRW